MNALKSILVVVALAPPLAVACSDGGPVATAVGYYGVGGGEPANAANTSGNTEAASTTGPASVTSGPASTTGPATTVSSTGPTTGATGTTGPTTATGATSSGG